MICISYRLSHRMRLDRSEDTFCCSSSKTFQLGNQYNCSSKVHHMLHTRHGIDCRSSALCPHMSRLDSSEDRHPDAKTYYCCRLCSLFLLGRHITNNWSGTPYIYFPVWHMSGLRMLSCTFLRIRQVEVNILNKPIQRCKLSNFVRILSSEFHW